MAQAGLSDGALRVELVTAYNLVVDSNAGTPSSYAPRSAYMGVIFHNDGTVPLTDVIARIGDYKGGTGDTPGIYPSRVHPGLTGPLAGGAFALTHEGGSSGLADATRYISSIPAGGSITVYWLVGYAQVDKNGIPTWGTSVKPDDDLWLQYDVWATGKQSGTTRTVDVTRTVTMRNEISAAANKIFPNGANKVPDYYKALMNQYVPSWTNAYADGTVGSSIATEGIWYDLGNVGEGFDNDGNLVPDHNLWMQPIGDPVLFDAGAFRLVHTYAMVVVKLLNGGEQILTGEDQLYFENVPDNNGAVGYVRYEFMPLLAGARSVTSPYQEVASGRDNEKFNADYGVSLGGAMFSGEARVLIDKYSNVTNVVPGGTISYSVAYTNAGTTSVGKPSAAVPLIVQDAVPAGSVYVSGSATNNNALPSGVSSYHVLYSTDGGVTWTATQPSPASSVTHIQWWLDGELSAAAAGAISFSVTVEDPYLRTNPLIQNVAGVSFGSGASFATDGAETLVTGNNSVGDTVFADTGVGTGGHFGNGIQDGTEPGLTGITVWLYADLNANGVADSGEPQVATTITDSNGAYLFNSLLDGKYVVVVDTADTTLPYGYTVTSVESYPVDLDSAHAILTGMNVLYADFGFAPALVLSKSRMGSATLSEGQEVTYTLAVTNSLMGDGSGVGQPAKHRLWAKSGTTGSNQKGWTTPENAYQLYEPDGLYALAPFRAAKEWLDLATLSIDPRPGSIASVKVVVPIRVNPPFDASDTLTVSVQNNGTDIVGTMVVTDCSALASGTSELSFDVTGARAWAWSDFASGNLFSIHLLSDGKPSAAGTIDVDAAALEITSTATVGDSSGPTTLDPVPLDDTFNPSRLQYVSAMPSPDSVTTNSGMSTLHWDNLGPIFAGGARELSVTFKVLQPPGNVSAPLTNTASVTQAAFLNGRPANPDEKKVIDTVLPTGTIGDFVWRDLNTNGVQNAGEPGISGVTVRLYTNSTVWVATAITDATGKYLFEGLSVSNTYTVTVDTTTLPGGAGTCTKDRDATPNSTTAFALAVASTTGGDTVIDADFGYNLQSLIRGSIWHDRDRDASPAPENGEELIGGVTVRLYAANGTTLLATTNTAADGTYSFAGSYVTNGTYVVKADATNSPLGIAWTRSYDTDGTGSANQVTVSLVRGGVATADYSYFLAGTAAVGDTLFYDWNGYGTQDTGTDAGIANITVRLYRDDNTNGVVDAGVDALVGTTVSATNGVYGFTGLPSGTYLVIVDEADPDFPARYLHTYDPQGALDGRSDVTLSTSTNLFQDFGYQPYGFNSIGDTVWYDANADGLQSGATERGLSSVTVSLYADLNGTGNYTQIQTAVTDASGNYLFASLPDGHYRVTVDTGSTGLPSDSFGHAYRPTTVTAYDVSVTGGQTYLAADFGFAPLGAIGDTIFWDNNANGGQDWSEPGIAGVTVKLYRDTNSNGVYNVGEPLEATLVTDANGNYLFSGLAKGQYAVVVYAASAPLTGATLRADPEMDGLPCPTPPVAGPTCDGQTGVNILPGSSFMGADFGYQPQGVIGDLLWIDLNTNGVFDAGEQGIPYVTVALYSGASLVATNVTDADGFYSFGNLSNGTYRVQVLTSDSDFPASVTASYDADHTPDSVASNIVISGGHVTSIGGNSVTNADLTLDFGYRYSGNNRVSGTVGMDVPTFDGLLNGSTTNGVGAGEYPFAGSTVYLYVWHDANTNNTVNTGESTLIASTSTATNGDYRFSSLPSGSAGDRYIVSLAAPASDLKLTTTTGNTSASWVSNTTNVLGITLSAYQVLAIVPVRDNIDFAFQTTKLFDYGDLPQSYSTVVGDKPAGPSHAVVTNQNLWLGNGVSTELNGKPTANASGDTFDDGVVKTGRWKDGTAGGAVTVTVGAGTGWLEAWVDFNQDGTFTNANERVISQAVSSTVNGGVYTLSFDIPVGTFLASSPTVLNSRFRLYPSEPLVPTYFGPVSGGEVEDYQLTFGSIGNFVWVDANGNGQQDGGEPGLSNVVARLYDTNSVVIGSVTSTVTGAYAFTGLEPGAYTVGFAPPAGYLFTTSNVGSDASDSDPLTGTNRTASVTLSSGQTDSTVDAGFYQGASISGFVRSDLNGNGIVEAGDTNGIVGVTVQLLNAASNVVATTTTAAGGAYSFTGLFPGAYTVREIDLGGWYSTTDVSLPNDNLIPVTLVSGQTASGNSFYDATRATIGDFVWVDANGNGQQDDGGGSGLSNVVIRLYDTNSVILATVTSTVSGAYAFTNLAAGSYTVGFAPPAGYLFTTSNVGNDATDSDPLTGTNRTAAVTLVSGQTNSTVDAGFYAAASVSGSVRVDLNGNGIVEAGDTNGIAGVTVQLLNAASNVVATTTTAADGSYSFAGLYPGAYTVRETDLGGWYSTTDTSSPNDNRIPVTLAIGQSSSGNTFHDSAYATIGDFVWVDANGNGQQDDGGGSGLSNVVVRLYNTNSVVLATATSTVSGAYAFTSLTAGSYIVGFAPPAGYLFTTSNVGSDASDSDPLTGTNRTATVMLVSGQTNSTVDAGYYLPASVSGNVRVDLNGNGIVEAGDTNGISGVTVQLLNAASNVVATTTTAAGGAYSFTGLFPGAYTVREIDLGGWNSTTDVSLPNDNLIPVTLVSGQSSSSNSFYDVSYASIGDFVWVDANGNGQQDDGAGSGLSNVVVRLYNTNSVVLATVTSTVSGAYAFTNLAAGNYTVGFAPPAGYLFTTSNVGSDASDSDPLTGTNRTASVTLVSGQTDSSIDAGFYAAASVSGYVRVDLNGNGIVEAGDTNGIAGVTVQLLNTASNVVATTTTAAGGAYSFTGLFPGAYTLRETDLGGWYSTTDVSLPNDNLIPVTLTSGQSSSGNSFYDTQRAAIGDFVWVDANGNGQQDDGAGSGLSNVVVRLYNTNSVVLATVTSTVSGAYAFTNLTAGTYTVGFMPPAGYLFTTSNVGSDASDSDPLTGTNRTATVTLTSGQTDSTVDAGFCAAATVSGSVRVDLNGNGIVDAGDTNGIAGVTVQLLNAASNVVATTTTAAGGAYSFTGLLPGAYTVRETDLGGWNSTTDVTAPNDNLIPVTLASGQTATGLNFYDTQPMSISGGVYLDANGNGVVDAGDTNGIAGVTVQLLNGASNVIATATTAVNGGYSFTNIMPGAYFVKETDLSGYYSTKQSGGGTNNLIAVTAVSGTSAIGNDFYDAAYTQINGMVWYDRDANGTVNSGELSFTNVLVYLDANSNGVADAGEAQKRTDVNGGYSFSGLLSGTYLVRVDTNALPAGFAPTYDFDGTNTLSLARVAIVDLVTVSNVNFGYRGYGVLGDRVFMDANANGRWDAGEGLLGVDVTLIGDTDGNGTTETIIVPTTADGLWTVPGLRTTTNGVPYTVTVDTADLPVGLTQNTVDPDGGGDSTASVSLTDAEPTRLDQDFGYHGTGWLGDLVWVDLDGDGVHVSGEPGISNVTVNLTWAGPDGNVATTNDNAIFRTVTGANGLYYFAGLPAGNFRVALDAVMLPIGLAPTYDVDGTGTPHVASLTLAANQTRTDVDFGYRGAGTLGDRIFEDVNGNGQWDAGEGLSGVGVIVFGDLNGDGASESTFETTGADGLWTVSGLRTSTNGVSYTVTVDVNNLPVGINQNTVDPDGGANSSASVTLTDAVPVRLDQDFGYRGIGTIGDRVWADYNGDGVQGPGEPGITNVTVRLTWAGADSDFATTNDNRVYTNVTGVSGNYGFTSLPDGEFRVEIVSSTVPSTLAPSCDLDGVETPHVADLTLAMGDTRNDVDFGYRGTGWIGDRVWVDLDGDGVQDAGEPGLPGVTVNLTWAGPDGNVATTNDNFFYITATDGLGVYSFDGLPSGVYRVATDSSSLPTGFSPTYDLDGTGTPHTASLSLALGQTRTDADFGYRGAGSVGDRIFVDVNSNGVWNVGEGVSNVHVTVTGDFNGDGSSESVIVMTGSDGLWTLAGLLAPPAGEAYTIAVATADLPANARANTVDPDGGNDSVASVTLTQSNANRLDQDFGYQNAGRIAGQVRRDADVDGSLADLDEGLPGVLITLYTDPNGDGNPADGTPVTTHVTDTNGLYAFEGLLPGAYVVVETDPLGATSTADVYGANDNRVPVVLASGGAVTGRDFLDAFPLRKTVDKALAVRDEILTYTITPELSIDTLLQAVSVTDTVPLGSDLYLSAISPNANGQVAGRTVTWALGSNQAGVSGAVTGSPEQAGTLVLTNTADTYVRKDQASVNYGTSATMFVRAHSSGARSSLLKFDLTAIPSGATVTQAILRTVVSTAAATDANVYRLTTAWGETSATWSRPLGGTTVWAAGGFSASDYAAASLGLISLRTTGATTLDVSSTVINWVAGSSANCGFALIATDNAYGQIHTREAATPANRPTLTVNWSIPKKVTTTTALHVPTALVAGTNQPVTVTMSVTTDTIITNVTPPAALGWTATGGATASRLLGPTPSGPLTLPVGTTAFTYVYNLSSGTNAGSVTFSGAPAGTNFFATATANSVLVSPPLTLQVRVTSTNAPVVNMATLTTATLFSQGVNSPLVTTELRRVNISGSVFLDTNGDLAFGGDTAVPGVTVQLWSDPNADGSPADGAVVASTLTGGDGSYLFASVLAGTHFVVVETDPATATSVADTQGALTDNRIAVYPQTVDLSGNNFLDNAAVYRIAGEVRDDVDLNGVFTNPDRPVGNVTVRLFTDPNGDGDPSDGQVFASTVTSMNGAYLFERVPNGSYVVIEIDPQGATSTGDTYGQNDNRVKVNLAGADSIDNDFLDEVDPGGYLYDTADGRIVSGGSVAVTGPGVATIMMTGTNGQYMFITDGTPGDYTVTVTPPMGYVIDPTRAPAGPVYDPTNGPLLVVLGSGESTNTLGYLVDSAAVANPFYYTFHLEPGDPIILNNNYPLVRLPSLGDRVWLDRNGNGLQDAGELGVSNVTVRLLGGGTNNVLGTTVTDALGGYGFANLTSGTYTVEFVAPAGAVFTTYHAGTNTLDSDALPATGRTSAMVLALGNNRTDVDAGLYVPALLYGYAFLDADTNLVREVVAGDTAMPNMNVSLWTNGVMLASTNTSLTGYYEFARLVPAVYEVRMLCTPSLIVAVPTAEPAASNPERNRAVPVSNYGDAFYTIVSGHGVSPNTGEPVNFGFTSPPLSTAMDLSVYVSADGVMLELSTSNESGYDDIVIYAWLNNAWVEVGRVLSADVWGEGSNRYTVKAHGLSADGAYYFMIVDEAGHEHFSVAPVAVQSIRVEAVRLDMQTLTLTFNTEMNSSYAIKVSTDLVHWTREYVSYPTAMGWSDYVNTPFTVIGTRIQVRVPANRAKAFFKIERVDE